MLRLSGPAGADPSAIGAAASRYLLEDDGWTSRHVEHVEVLDEVFARRRLTVDLTLPTTRGASVGRAAETRLFVLPVALMRKDRPVTGIDVLAEDGRRLPLLTRAENGAITAEALIASAKRMVCPYRWAANSAVDYVE